MRFVFRVLRKILKATFIALAVILAFAFLGPLWVLWL